MIIDCHTHIWSSPEQLGQGAAEYLRRQAGTETVSAEPSEHVLASKCVDKTLVMGFRSRQMGASVPNDFIAQHVSRHSQRLVGIAAIDPTEPDAAAEADKLLQQTEFRGLWISPATQGFHPADSQAMEVYEIATGRGAPVFVHQGTHFPQSARMEYARPFLLDEIATDFPDLTLVISSLGHPWVEECIALLGKHPRVFADIAELIRRPWQAYNALVLAHQYAVMDKVLFGSDFPFFTAAEAIEAVYRMHEVTQGTNLPSVPRETLRSMVERNSLASLGIARPGEEAIRGVDEGEEL